MKDRDVRVRERHLDEGAHHEHIISMVYDKNRARYISLRFGNLLEADERKHDDDS